VAVQGRCAWDEWVAPFVTTPECHYGGSAGNVAVSLAQLGLTVRLASSLGQDARGRTYRSWLEACGVSTRHLKRAQLTPICRIKPGQYYTWRQGGPEAPNFSIHELSSVVAGVNAYVVSDDAPPDCLRGNFLRYWQPQLWLDRQHGEDIVQTLSYGKWNAVFLNNRERVVVEEKCGMRMDELSARLPSVTFVCTRESDPIEVREGGRSRSFPIRCVRKPVVALGGGDAFVAGFVYAATRGEMLSGCIRWGQALAAEVVSRVGCQLRTPQMKTLHNRLRGIERSASIQ
jgi:sugar/nucleoside kinase (ribokinase family)